MEKKEAQKCGLFLGAIGSVLSLHRLQDGGKIRIRIRPQSLNCFFVDSASSHLSGNHKTERVYKKAVVTFLHPVSQFQLIRKKNRIWGGKADDILDGRAWFRRFLKRNYKSLPNSVGGTERYQDMGAGYNRKPVRYTISEQTVQIRMGYVNDNLTVQAGADPFS